MNWKWKIGGLIFIAYVILALCLRPHYAMATSEICLSDGSGNPAGCSLLGDFNSETKRIKADTNGNLLVNGLGAAGISGANCEVKKKSFTAGATSTTYLNPSSSMTAFLFKNESANQVCFIPKLYAITKDNSLCLDAYGSAVGNAITVTAFSAINAGSVGNATMTVMFCK